MTRHEQRIGRAGQNVAAAALSRIGVEMVEQIGTPVILTPAHAHRKDIFRVRWGEKVSGDHRGILHPGGRSVLAETKTILDRNLRFSDLREHQPGRLDAHATFGGLSLLVWVHNTETFIMRWPVEGFGPGKSITLERARELNITQITVSSIPVENNYHITLVHHGNIAEAGEWVPAPADKFTP
jgi:hypothetical protein